MRDRRGFSLLELVIVLVLGGIIASVAINSFGNAQSRMGPRSAQSQFLTMHAHTRAIAVERGGMARLTVTPGTGVVSVDFRATPDDDWELLQERDFGDSYGVAIETGGGGDVRLCMSPRGYAAPSPCTSFDDEARIRFIRGGQAAGIVLLPLGQALRP
jgi:prepilin-type N-terminal cleavage/methylation domain-containing protein